MSRSIDDMREKAARAVMEASGFLYTGKRRLLDEAADGNPRVGGWVATGDAVLRAVHPRLMKAVPRSNR